MGFSKTYTVAELEEATGFDRRTIAYYISQGLLPKVGRRGPKTRYSQEFLDRLKLIQRIRELADAGRVPSATLAEIGQALRGLPAEELARLARKSTPESALAGLFEDLPGAVRQAAEFASFGPAEPMAEYEAGDALRAAALERPRDTRPEAASRRRERLLSANRRLVPELRPPADVALSLEEGRATADELKDMERQLQQGVGRLEEIERQVKDRSARLREMEQELGDRAARLDAQERQLKKLQSALAHERVPPSIRAALRELETRAARARNTHRGTTAEPLLRVPVSDNIMLSVRGLTSREDREFAEHVAALLAEFSG